MKFNKYFTIFKLNLNINKLNTMNIISESIYQFK